ncbi:MAG: polysaccharide pyruvyl transferase family protein, partial [Rickettsiales bacterium]|nr:polysaccharide pyruvyl transferase family protein [Rickettsiales bacterium]
MATQIRHAGGGDFNYSETPTETFGKNPRTDITFVHWTGTKNVGDINAAPYIYFDFGGRSRTVLNVPDIGRANSDALVVGGGKILLDQPEWLAKVESAKNIIWGVGAEPGLEYSPELLGKFQLVGVREYSSPMIDGNQIFFVPCASCMSPIFDKKHETKHGAVFYYHATRTTPAQFDAMAGIPKYPNNLADMEEAIGFIASGDGVITNSYHGAYWALLLGKKVVCMPFNEKFFGFEFKPEYC